jgi:hypothetical protein
MPPQNRNSRFKIDHLDILSNLIDDGIWKIK